MEGYVCPICGYHGLAWPPRVPDAGWPNGFDPSYESCPSCGFEFGVTDLDRGISDKDYRAGWIARGCPWHSKARKSPTGWNAEEQLRRLRARTLLDTSRGPMRHLPDRQRAAFDCAAEAEEKLLARFPHCFGKIYPVVPFVAEDVSARTFLSLGLLGAMADALPPHCSYEESAAFLTPPQVAVLSEMLTVVAETFSPEQICPIVEFDSKARIDAAGAQFYFR